MKKFNPLSFQKTLNFDTVRNFDLLLFRDQDTVLNKIKSFAVVKKKNSHYTVAPLPSVASSHLSTILISASTVEEPHILPKCLGSTISSNAGLSPQQF